MSGPRIKICGISTAESLSAIIAARADYCGFVFFPRSPRHVSLEQVAALADRAEGRIARVGLFVDADDLVLEQAVAAARLDALQLHGDESPERAAELRARFVLPVWKAIPVAAPGDVERAERYRGAVDLVLFDAKTPKGALPGGMGLSFDWSLLSAWKDRAPWGLAGGLNPSNVAEAAALTRAPLVDTSSGVESAPGVKDEALIAAFCAAARA
ncbi:phosphoribosylanthranilate isomerase [Novosphingobium flavum]|uniref:N-(5'-phosphoribosyl)anthranilate isomerase n=1 Tax=Novosphingobium flavum TaxID=1778672 RepID=A0A7X1FUT2_9SPHN|nr:phosphoribosylanthranilate isomerase [Novosphingobium flavum]MBC2667390.1 phosphoribosylanthranilate isomerase [Novosphingobium flavum]